MAPYLQHAALAGTAIAIAAGLIGYFLVLRSQVFTTDALGHVTYTGAMSGLAFAFNPLVGLFAATVAVAGGFAVLGRRARADDVVIGSTFAWVLGVGALFQRLFTEHHSSGNGRAGATYLFGSIFGISATQAVVSVVICAGVCIAMALIARPLLFASIDEAVAVARGVPVRLLGAGFLIVVGVTCAEAAQAVGALLLLGLVSAPAGAAHRLTTRPLVGLALAAAIAVLSTWAGLLISYEVPRTPPSFAIIGVATLSYLMTFMWQPGGRTRRPLLIDTTPSQPCCQTFNEAANSVFQVMRSLPRRVMARASLLAATSLLASVGVLVPQVSAQAASYVPPLPHTTATAYVVADATTGRILAARDMHGRLAPASTLKVLTLLTALPHLAWSDTIKGTYAAAGVDGTKVGINPGQAYTAKQLFTAMMVMSGNDAAMTIGAGLGGLPKAISEMNAMARHLQAHDTVAHTTNGLDALGQTSSAYDLAMMFRDGLASWRFRYYIALRSASFPLAHGRSYPIYTHDRLLNSYPGMLGGKNGYTIAANASYVGAATRNGHTIIVAVMRDVPNFWPEVTSLLNWGFAADGHVQALGYLQSPLRG